MDWLEERAEALDPDFQVRLSTNPRRIVDSKNKDTQELLEVAPTLADSLCDVSHKCFDEVQRGLSDFLCIKQFDLWQELQSAF